MQKIKPNRLYGVRTRYTLNNKTIWYRINRIYGLSAIASAFCFFLLSILLGNWRTGSSENISITLFIIEVSVPVIITFIKLTQIKKE
ncbi:SdpI family protein [Pseudescherichia sp.]|uniref:SdpI family protein n=1 Tax=Pseudescherichia sp. TaxID=2055881 RepID=UPI0028A0DB91|nr:SdpI family protein [Pseudescherichia sp.]